MVTRGASGRLGLPLDKNPLAQLGQLMAKERMGTQPAIGIIDQVTNAVGMIGV